MSNLQPWVSAEIRAEIGRQDLTRSQLSDRLAWHRMRIYRKLDNYSVLTVDELDAIAEMLKVPAAELMRRADEARACAAEALNLEPAVYEHALVGAA